MYTAEQEAGIRNEAISHAFRLLMPTDSDPDKIIEVADKIADFILNGKKGK